MEGNAKIIKLIARDEALHLTGTQHMINLMKAGEDDAKMAEIAAEVEPPWTYLPALPNKRRAA